MKEGDNILRILKETLEAIKQDNVTPLKDLSDQEIAASVHSHMPETAKSKDNIYTIPENITVEIPDFSEEKAVYSFFPDGSASGPEMLLIIKGHKMSITISQLTGLVMTKETTED